MTRFWYNPAFKQWELDRTCDPSLYPDVWCLLTFEEVRVLAKWSKSNYMWIGTNLCRLDVEFDTEWVIIDPTEYHRINDMPKDFYERYMGE
jgi:hypothetical protein